MCTSNGPKGFSHSSLDCWKVLVLFFDVYKGNISVPRGFTSNGGMNLSRRSGAAPKSEKSDMPQNLKIQMCRESNSKHSEPKLYFYQSDTSRRTYHQPNAHLKDNPMCIPPTMESSLGFISTQMVHKNVSYDANFGKNEVVLNR